MGTLLLNSCYQLLWSSEQTLPPRLTTWFVHAPFLEIDQKYPQFLPKQACIQPFLPTHELLIYSSDQVSLLMGKNCEVLSYFWVSAIFSEQSLFT